LLYLLENEKKTSFRIIQRIDKIESDNDGLTTQGQIFECRDKTVPDKYQIYSPPFSGFPKITSHMHPHLALYNLGEKIERLYGSEPLDWMLKYRKKVPQLDSIWNVYRTWIRAKIPLEFMNEENKETEDGGQSGSGPRPRSNSGPPRPPPSHPRTRSQVTRSSRNSAPLRQGDVVNPGDSISYVEGDSDESSSDDDDDEEEIEESWSTLKKRVNMWRNSISSGLEPEHNTSCQKLSDALAIQKVPSRDSDGSGTLVTQTGHGFAPEKVPGVLDVHSSVLSPLST
jgi:hypothetical protein